MPTRRWRRQSRSPRRADVWQSGLPLLFGALSCCFSTFQAIRSIHLGCQFSWAHGASILVNTCPGNQRSVSSQIALPTKYTQCPGNHISKRHGVRLWRHLWGKTSPVSGRTTSSHDTQDSTSQSFTLSTFGQEPGPRRQKIEFIPQTSFRQERSDIGLGRLLFRKPAEVTLQDSLDSPDIT